MNHKNKRIVALFAKGLGIDQIARKIGYGNPPSEDGLERVRHALKLHQLGLKGIPEVIGQDEIAKFSPAGRGDEDHDMGARE